MHRSTKIQLVAAGASLLLWALPGAGFVLLPLELLNTHIHELCHALAAVATGGEVAFIRVFGNGSGVTPVAGSNGIILASAGYMGAAFLGGVMILAAHTQKGAQTALLGLAAALALTMILWVRGDLAGVASGVLWIFLLFALGRSLKGDALLFAAQFLGLQQCLRSVQSLYTLLQVNAFSNVQNDAKIAETLTGVPSLVWALAWCGLSAAWMAVAFAPSFRRKGRSSG
jgi:hypothetical protein